MSLEVALADTPARLDLARVLMAEYLDWVVARTAESGLDAELLRAHWYAGGGETLPGAFAPPDGCLLIATVEQRPAGLVGFGRSSASVCEMKRLYVRTEFRGHRAGRALIGRLIEEARAAGYVSMRLETRTFMPDAIALYEAVGFRACPAFHAIPPAFEAATRFMERTL